MTHRLALYVNVWKAKAQVQTMGDVENENENIIFTVEQLLLSDNSCYLSI